MFEAKKGSILPIPSEKCIKEAEEYFEVRFPKDYLAFLSKYNGAEPAEANSVFLLDGHEYVVERFFCLLDRELWHKIGEDEWCDISVITTKLEEYLADDGDGYGLPIVPVAAVGGGDAVCLDFRKNPDNPTICMWYNDESDVFAPATEFLADNFEQFLGMLYKPSMPENWEELLKLRPEPIEDEDIRRGNME